MKRIMVWSLVALAFSSCVTETDLREIDLNKAVLVDVRTPQEYASGSAPSAINLPLSTLSEGIDIQQDTSKMLVVFCRSGSRASKAKKILSAKGYRVVNGFTVSAVKSAIETQQQQN